MNFDIWDEIDNFDFLDVFGKRLRVLVNVVGIFGCFSCDFSINKADLKSNLNRE